MSLPKGIKQKNMILILKASIKTTLFEIKIESIKIELKISDFIFENSYLSIKNMNKYLAYSYNPLIIVI